MNWRILPLSLILAACTYSETPFGRYAEIDLPVQSQTTIHKTVTVNAPPGTTVNISETPVYYDPPPRRRCYYDEYERRRVCYRSSERAQRQPESPPFANVEFRGNTWLSGCPRIQAQALKAP